MLVGWQTKWDVITGMGRPTMSDEAKDKTEHTGPTQASFLRYRQNVWLGDPTAELSTESTRKPQHTHKSEQCTETTAPPIQLDTREES